MERLTQIKWLAPDGAQKERWEMEVGFLNEEPQMLRINDGLKWIYFAREPDQGEGEEWKG